LVKSEFIQIEGDSYKTLENEIQRSISSSSVNNEILSNRDENEKPNQENEGFHNISPLILPSKDKNIKEKLRYYICWPTFLVLYYTIPNSRDEKWGKFYLITFFMSLIWLSLFSYIMIWMITIIGKSSLTIKLYHNHKMN
jgi:hypothetical protein